MGVIHETADGMLLKPISVQIVVISWQSAETVSMSSRSCGIRGPHGGGDTGYFNRIIHSSSPPSDQHRLIIATCCLNQTPSSTIPRSFWLSSTHRPPSPALRPPPKETPRTPSKPLPSRSPVRPHVSDRPAGGRSKLGMPCTGAHSIDDRQVRYLTSPVKLRTAARWAWQGTRMLSSTAAT
jgi:hypothetical protein